MEKRDDQGCAKKRSGKRSQETLRGGKQRGEPAASAQYATKFSEDIEGIDAALGISNQYAAE
jgi:hypothetical protein